MSIFFYVPQYFTTQLSVAGGIDDTQTTGIVLQDISGVDATKPGIIALTWSNPIDTTKIEYIFYTSINESTKELQGVTRGQEGYSAKSHLNGATVAWPLSKSHINNIPDSTTTFTNKTMDYLSNTFTNFPSSSANSLSQQAIINGNFDVWQRGTTFTTPNDDTYGPDRWNFLMDGNGAWTFSQSLVVSEKSKYSLKCVNVTANKQCGIVQILEAGDSQKFYNQNLTLSFKARTTTGKVISKLRCVLLKWEGTADSVTSDVVGTWAGNGTNPTWAANWTAVGTPVDLTLTTSFSSFSQTGNVGENIGNIAIVVWTDDTSITAGDEFYITEVQLCAGDVALPFMPKSYEDELRACNRYLFRLSGAGETILFPMAAQSTTSGKGAICIGTPMRSTGGTLETSTITGDNFYLTTGAANASITAIAKDSITLDGKMITFQFTVASGLTAGVVYFFVMKASGAYIQVNNEL